MSDDEKYLDDLEFYEAKFSRASPGRKGVKRKHDARPERALEDAGLVGPIGEAANWAMTFAAATPSRKKRLDSACCSEEGAKAGCELINGFGLVVMVVSTAISADV